MRIDQYGVVHAEPQNPIWSEPLGGPFIACRLKQQAYGLHIRYAIDEEAVVTCFECVCILLNNLKG